MTFLRFRRKGNQEYIGIPGKCKIERNTDMQFAHGFECKYCMLRYGDSKDNTTEAKAKDWYSRVCGETYYRAGL